MWAERSSRRKQVVARHASGGLVTVQFVTATALTLLFIVIVCNGLLDLYVRAAVRDALDDGVRSAVPAAAGASTCQERVDAALAALVRGPVARGIVARCAVDADKVQADADLQLPSFVPSLIPPWHVRLHASALREQP